ncbi:MAG: hypothetical protein ABI678_06870, partial [Kofleriaceae bacterium]
RGDAGSTPSDAPANCLGTGAFSNVQPVSAVNGPGIQYGSFISPDGLTLLFDQAFMSDERLFVATRPDRTSEFSAASLVPGLAPGGNDSDASITADGLELFFDSDRGSSICVWRATRSAVSDPFDPPVRQEQLCTTGQFAGPSISADGLTLVYNSSLDQVAEGELYLSVRSNRGVPFPPGTRLANLPSTIGYPFLSADRLRLWFEQEVGNGVQLASTVRISPSDNFTSLMPVAELDDGNENGDLSLTLDEAEVFFSSSRAGDYDIWHASRPCL